MSWVSLVARIGGVAFLLPLIITRLTAEEVVVWYIFTTVTSLIIIMDFGFSPTLSRLYGYVHGGASISEIKRGAFSPVLNRKVAVNLQSLALLRLFSAKSYLILSGSVFVVGGAAAALALNSPITNSGLGWVGWLGWLIVLTASSIQLYSMRYSVELQGSNRIADVQSRQALTSCLSLISAGLSLFMELSFLCLVISYYTWQVVYFFVIRSRYYKVVCPAINADKLEEDIVWSAAWPSIWKSGLGLLMSVGLIQSSGIIYAQLAPAAEVASYMISLQLIRALSQFSQVPFYVKLPVYAKQYASGMHQAILKDVPFRMRLSYLIYTLGFFFIALYGDDLLSFIGSDILLPSGLVWSIMGAAILIERFGAMHIQLYSLTNNIIWHVANGVTGVLMIVIFLLLYPEISVLAFPASMLISYLSFYSWFSTKHSYNEYSLTFFGFDRFVFLPFFIIFSAWVGWKFYVILL